MGGHTALGWRDLGLAALVSSGLAVALYPRVIRPWHLGWGATPAEALGQLPGDVLIPRPTSASTRATTIHAPVEHVWPWVVQMGQGRGGLYSYELLENLLGSDIHNADRIVPEWQELRVGDTFRLASAKRYPDLALVVEAVEPPRLLLLRSPNVGGTPPDRGADFGYTWAFVLEPLDATTTRLLARGRYQGPPRVVLPIEAMQFVMEQAMLRGLKRRAEGAAPSASPV
jgi:hypothetical protein